MRKKNKIDLAIITNESFPVGMAATNRILSYAKTIAIEKSVKVYIPKPTEDIKNQLNFTAKGIIDDIQYEYMNKTTLWPFNKSKIIKLRIVLIGYFKLIHRIAKEKPKTIIIYSSDFILRVLLIWLKLIISYRLIIEENEYPKILKKTKNNLIRKIHLYLYRKCDGMMLMTNELAGFFKEIKVKEIFVLPMTVDVTRFLTKTDFCPGFKYFIYAGGGGGFQRDGVFDIIKGFYQFQRKHINYKLLLIGPVDCNDKNIKEIKKYISDKGLEHHVVFEGVKHSNDIIKYLQNATGIVMAPPVDFPSGGFPTKLGEFLMSGKPVITSKVSDIPLYLNAENSFLVKPQDLNMLSDTMESIITNKERARQIGMAGKEMAKQAFNANTYKKDLLSFLGLNSDA